MGFRPKLKVTIVIPTIERKTLKNAMDSVHKQTQNCHLLVQADLDREGPGETRNELVRRATTEYVGFLDDDDVLHPQYIEWFNRYNRNADLFIFQMQMPDGSVLPGKRKKHQLEFGTVGISFLMKRELAREYPFIHEVPDKLQYTDWEMIKKVRDRGHRIIISQKVAYYVRPEQYPLEKPEEYTGWGAPSRHKA